MNSEKTLKRIFIAVSIIVPVVVALLFRVKIQGYDFSFLPSVYATINGITAITLIFAWRAIIGGNKEMHQKLIYIALGLSLVFLILYILYHITSESTVFGGEGPIKYIYYVLLISHILLSIIIIPFVLFTLLRALLGKFEMHKKLAKITMPLWIYVALSGVFVYILISPYYGT